MRKRFINVKLMFVVTKPQTLL